MTTRESLVLASTVFAALLSVSASALARDADVETVALLGVPPAEATSILATLATRPGAPLSERAAASDVKRLWRLGRFDDVQVTSERQGRAVIFRVEEHPLGRVLAEANAAAAIVESVEIRGNSKTKDSVIRREVSLAPGDPLEREAVVASAKRIRALGFFDSVAIEARAGSTARLITLTFVVSERETGEFRVGTSYGEYSGFGVMAEVAQSNLFGTGRELALAARLSRYQRRLELRYSNPRIADTLWRGTATLYNVDTQSLGFRRAATGGTASLARPLGNDNRIQLTYRLEDVSMTGFDSALAAFSGGPADYSPDLFRSGLTSSVRADLIHDSRTANFEGVAVGVNGEIASSRIGSDNQFRRVGAWVDLPVAVAGKTGFVFRGGIDWITSPDHRGVPLSERLRAGGLGSVRGYAPESLGPIVADAAGVPRIAYGGNLRLLASAELHFPIASFLGLSGLVFADAGNVFNLERRSCRRLGCPTAAEILTGLRASVGFGFHWRSPLGRLRFEWGVPLARRAGDPKVRFHFGLGPLNN